MNTLHQLYESQLNESDARAHREQFKALVDKMNKAQSTYVYSINSYMKYTDQGNELPTAILDVSKVGTKRTFFKPVVLNATINSTLFPRKYEAQNLAKLYAETKLKAMRK